MHRGEIHVDLSQVCDKQQQCNNQTTMCRLGKVMIVARQSASMRGNGTEIGIDFSWHENFFDEKEVQTCVSLLHLV